MRMRGQGLQRRVVDAQRGMTLLEIMIVVAIIGLVMSGVTVVAINQWRKAQQKEAARAVHNLVAALDIYATQNQNPCPSGLDELVTQKVIAKHPRDPWGEDFVYRCPGDQNREGADVISKGPDRKEGTADDIKSWEL